MLRKIPRVLLTTAAVLVSVLNTADGVLLRKKQTLRLMYAGHFQHGSVCMAVGEQLLDNFNRRLDLLPDYNVVVDYFDDQCKAPVLVRRAIDILERIDADANVSAADAYGDGLIPANASYIQFSARTAIVTPIVLGPVCTESCKFISLIALQFKLISIQAFCLGQALDGKSAINSFRYSPSEGDMREASVAFLLEMAWTEVAFLSSFNDTSSYSNARHLAEQLEKAGIKVIADEFYLDDARPSLRRLKQAGVRIIFGICTPINCAKLGCSIAAEDYYGPNIVWIFGDLAEFLQPFHGSVPNDCDLTKLKEFAETTVYVHSPSQDKSVKASESGISHTQVMNMVKQRIPMLQHLSPLVRTVACRCFDELQAALFILDKVDRRLKNENSSLANLLASTDSSRNDALVYFRNAAQHLNISGLRGRLVLASNSKRAIGVKVLVSQIVSSTRRPIFSFDLALKKLVPLSKPVWRTVDGAAPQLQPEHRLERLQVPRWLLVTVRAMLVLLLLAYADVLATIVSKRKHFKIKNSFYQMSLVSVVGICANLVAAFLYPEGHDIRQFCTIAPELLMLGHAATMGGLVFKVLTPVLFNMNGRFIEFQPRTQKIVLCIVGIWMIANVVLVATSYGLSGPMFVAAVRSRNVSINELVKATVVTTQVWQTCAEQGSNYVLKALLIAHGLLLFIGVFASFRSFYGQYQAISDTPVAGVCICGLFALSVVTLATNYTVYGFCGLVFALVSAYVISIGLGVLVAYVAFLWKIQNVCEVNQDSPLTPARHLGLTQWESSRIQSARARYSMSVPSRIAPFPAIQGDTF